MSTSNSLENLQSQFENVYFAVNMSLHQEIDTAIEDSTSNFRYELVVVHSMTNSQWKVIRTYEDFVQLHQSIIRVLPALPSLPPREMYSLPSELVSTLTSYLRMLISLCTANIWSYPALLKFLDSQYGASPILILQILEMSKKLSYLEDNMSVIASRNQFFMTSLIELSEKFNSMEIHHNVPQVSLSPKTNASMRSSSNGGSINSSRNQQLVQPLLTLSEQIDSELLENPEFNWIASPKTVVTMDSDPSVSNSTTMPAYNEGVHTSPLKEERKTIAKGPEGPHDNPTMDFSVNTFQSSLDLKSTPIRVDNLRIQIDMPRAEESETAYSYDKSSLLAVSSIPTNEEPNEIDKAVEEMIRILIPHDEQITYRQHVSQSLIYYLRRSTGVIAVDISFNAIKCTLPDDSFKIAIMTIKGTAGSKLQLVFDRLVRTSEGLSELPLIDISGMITGQLPAFNDSVESILSLTGIEEDMSTPCPPAAPLNQFKIENVSSNHTAPNEEHYIKLEINSIAMEISENPRYELSFFSFLEEFAALVGRDYLFKRSLLLIRAWWYYETAAYIGCAMKHYLSDTALCVMICSVFNLYHHSIRTPFQALCIFLAEYSDFDWMSCVITLQGIISIRDSYDVTSKNIDAFLRSPREGHLITFDLLLKYKMILANIIQPVTTPRGGFVITNVNNSSSQALITPSDFAVGASVQSPRSGIATANESTNTIAETSGRLSKSGSQKRFFPETNDDLISPVSAATVSTENSSSGSSSCSDDPFSMSAYTPTYGSIPINTSNSSIVTNLGATSIIPTQQLQSQSLPFEKLCLNILNPFTHGNMVSDKINLRRAKRVIKVFQMGARNIQTILTKVDHKNVVSTFFRNIQSRFSDGWRPDLLSKTCVNENISLSQACLIWANAPKSPELEKMYKRGIFSCKFRSLQEQTWIWANYCNFLQEGIVNDIGVLTAVKEILIDRGTMPVGEIGKLLQEIINIPNISNRLKERYGGLKKFLEKYPDDFVVSTDHPFNPHVFLKKLMSAEDLGIINRGLVSPHLTSKIKKASLLAKKKTSIGLGGTPVTSNLMTNTATATVDLSVTSSPILHSYPPLSPKNYSNISSTDYRSGNSNMYSGGQRDNLQQIGFNRDITGMTGTTSSPNLSVVSQPQGGGPASGYRTVAINRTGSLGSIPSNVSSSMQMNQGIGRDFTRRRINTPVIPIQSGSMYRDSNSSVNNSSISGNLNFHSNYHSLPDSNHDLYNVGGGTGMTSVMNGGNNSGMSMNSPTLYQSRSSVASSDIHGTNMFNRGQGRNQGVAIGQTDNLTNLYSDRNRWNQSYPVDSNDYISTGAGTSKLVGNRSNTISRSSVSQDIGMSLGIGYSNSPSITNQKSSLLQGLGVGANAGGLNSTVYNETSDGNIFQQFEGDDSELQEPPGLPTRSSFGLQGQGLGSGQNLSNSFNRDLGNYPYPGAFAESQLYGRFHNGLEVPKSNIHSDLATFSASNLQSYGFNDSKNQFEKMLEVSQY